MAKLQRWIDLLAALLSRRTPVTLEQLTEAVPGYLKAPTHEAMRRTFERDKDELRAFGIPLATIKDPGGEVIGYQLRNEHFYLPYLSLVQQARATSPRRVDKYGYRSLPSLAFEADELSAVVEAAARVKRLGIPALDELAASALRKLAFDLPADAVSGWAAVRQEATPYRARAAELPDTLARLDDALRRRKRVRIDYVTVATGVVSTRTVHPYGLFFLGHHWYLAARDAADGPVKNFRLSRILALEVHASQPAKPDYEIAAGFDLAAHARSRQAWELGDTDAVEVVVAFRGLSGPTVAARRLGEPVEGEPEQRRFLVRRQETFVRWLLSFAGEAVPISPAAVVEAWRELVRRTRDRYREAS